jgi:hypothetical protein
VRVTAPSTCPWLDHPVSGLKPTTWRPCQTRFRCAYTLRLKLAADLNSLTHYAKGTPSPATCARAPTACRHPVSGSVSPRSLRCFSPFPHGTGSLSVAKEYLGLEGGPPIFGQDCTCPALLEDMLAFYPYGAVTRYGPTFQRVPVLTNMPLAWSAFARRY